MWILTLVWGPDVELTFDCQDKDDVIEVLAAVCGCKNCAPRVYLRWKP